MIIKYDRQVNLYGLIINDICYGHYDSTVAAADDVYIHVTGCSDWDALDGTFLDVPTDIYEWNKDSQL